MTFPRFHRYAYIARCGLRCFFLVWIGLFSFERHSKGAELFSAQSLAVEGSILSVIPADLEGRGSADILVVHKTGVYPKEKRWISIFSAGTTGQYAATARQRWEVDPAATVFDVGDVAPSPGKEIFYLTGNGIHYYVRKHDGRFSTRPHGLLSFPTITPFPAAGSLPRGRLFADWKGNGRKMLLLPQFGSLVLLDRDGSGGWRKKEQVSVEPRTFLYSDRVDDGAFRDYSLNAVFRVPRIFVKDFNGDRRPDLLLTEQETVSVYLHQPGGHFTPRPFSKIVFPVRPSGKDGETNLSILSTPVDVNSDGFVDLILTLTKGTGKFLEWKIIIFLFLNQQKPDDPFLPEPDQTITVEGITPGINIEDANGDGKQDLILSYIRVGFWNIVKNIISKRANVETSIYLLGDDNRYPAQPDFQRKTSYRIDLTHGIRFHGTWPTLRGDFTGDGKRDLLIAHDEEIAIYPRHLDGGLFADHFIQSGVFTSPFMHIVDLNRDGRDDLLFYEKKRDGKIAVLMNRVEGGEVNLTETEPAYSDER